MTTSQKYLPIVKDTDTIRNTVLANIVKMLSSRGWILRENVGEKTKKIIDSYNDEQLYKLELDVNLGKFDTYDPPDDDSTKKQDKNFNDKIVYIKLLPQKVTSISKSPIITEFLNTYKNSHKILIVDSISDKSKHQLTSNKYMEVFLETHLLIDILSHVCSPQYEVLSNVEAKEVLESYNVTKKQMKKQNDTDPISLYYFLKKKQILRIIRNSEITGHSTDYRIVIHKGK
mgnify:CR=1 FL=1